MLTDGDTLARSQLALLQRLGLLAQDAGEEENDPHAFLNRLPPSEAHALPPNDAPRAPSFQSSGERGTATWKQAAGDASVHPYEPLISIKIPAGDGTPPSAPRVPLSPLSFASLGSDLRPRRFSFASSFRRGRDPAPPLVLERKWFGVWKQSVELQARRAQAETIGDRGRKRRVVRRLQTAVYRRRLTDARCRQLQFWRAKRAVCAWAAFASLRGRVSWVLSSGGRGFALVNRLRRERTFVRWRQFVVWSRRRRRMNTKAEAAYQRRVQRRAWLEWCVLLAHGRHARRLYRCFFITMKSELVRCEERYATATRQYASHAGDRLKRMLRRWRLFNDARQRDHIRTWRIRMILQRGKFFAIWHGVLREKQRTEALHLQVSRRIKREHILAWRSAARASVLGRSSTLWHPEAICARYLHVWKRWASETVRFRHATAVVHARQQRRALRVMRVWTTEHARISRLQTTANAITRRRILTFVWENGWTAFHFRRQLEKKQAKQVQVMTHARVLSLWRLAWSVRHEWRAKKKTARRMGFRSATLTAWSAWRKHTMRRRHHKRQLRSAAEYYQHHLLISGLVALSKIVDRKCTHTTAARRIRVAQRTALIRRVFRGWANFTTRRILLGQRVDQFISRPSHAHSMWNPLRRTWLRWKVFALIRKKLHTLGASRCTTIKRIFFRAWKRRTFISSIALAQLGRLKKRHLKRTFEQWRRRTREWRHRSDLCRRARVLCRRVYCSKVFRAWCTLTGRLRNARLLCELVAFQSQQQLATRALGVWRDRLHQARAIHELVSRRRLAWFQLCFDAWNQYHLEMAKHKRKLRYYRQVFGLFPTTSPFRRLWYRWKSRAELRAAARQLRRRCQLHIVRACLYAWKTFRMAKVLLRSWHTFSVVAGATKNDLGRRLRLFHQRRRLLLARRTLLAWFRVTLSRRIQQERLVMHQRRILRDIEVAQTAWHKRRRCHLRLWFSRWRRRQLTSLHVAVQWRRRRLCLRVIRAWWRKVIHSKQERLLKDARQTVEMMTGNSSFRQAQRISLDTARAMRLPAKSTARPKPSASARSLLPSRTVATVKRMIDPDIRSLSYSQQQTRQRAQVPKSKTRDLVPPARVTEQLGQRQVAHAEHVEDLAHRSPQDNRVSAATAVAVTERRFRKDLHGTRVTAVEPYIPVHDHRRSASFQMQELPLFDNDSEESRVEVVPSQGSTNTTPCTTYAPPRRHSKKSVEHDPDISLESIASMDLYSPAKEPSRHPENPLLRSPTRASHEASPQSTQPRHHDVTRVISLRSEPPVEPTLYTPAQSLLRQVEVTLPRTRMSRNVSEERSVAKQELADILEVPQRSETPNLSAFRTVLRDMRTEDNAMFEKVDVDGVFVTVIKHYVQISEANVDRDPHAWLEVCGFSLLRDLGLFTNGYFLGAMEQAIKRLPLEGLNRQRQLERLLYEFLAKHPRYVSHTSSRSESSPAKADPISWLVNEHLARRHGRTTLSASVSQHSARLFWIRHELPHDVVTSLPKLIKCIKKYQRPLDQFFGWRPEKSSSVSNRGHMDSPTFVALMKYCNVYPQLFDRRELEDAVECAGSRHHHGVSHDMQLNMPQFVEAVVRCSLRLKWLDETPGQAPSSDLTVVIKFLMLVFAMEGRGSMLTKRSQDLDVVLRFLKQQQQSTVSKTAKLRRFQGLLRAESSASKARLMQNKTTFRMAMTGNESSSDQLIAGNVPKASSHISEPDDRFCVLEHERHDRSYESLASGKDVRNELQSRLTQRYREEHSLGGTQRDSIDDHQKDTTHTRSQSNSDNSSHHYNPRSDNAHLETAIEHDIRIAPQSDEGQLKGFHACNEQPAIHVSPTEPKDQRDMSLGAFSLSVPTTLSTDFNFDSEIRAPMDRDAFLNEILSSIQDVELLLQHSDGRRPSQNVTRQGTDNMDIELTSEPFSAAYPERYAVLMNGQLPSGIEVDNDSETNLLSDDIRVSDPLLDRLTFADRFSESRDWQAHLSIADLAAHGIHATIPSAIHIRTNLDTGELDDLTDPQRTAAYLRAEEDDDHQLAHV